MIHNAAGSILAIGCLGFVAAIHRWMDGIFVPFWAFVLTILILVSQWILHIRKNRKEDESLMLDAATISLTNSQSNAAKKD